MYQFLKLYLCTLFNDTPGPNFSPGCFFNFLKYNDYGYCDARKYRYVA